MGWATTYIAALQKGEVVNFRPRGNSMSGKIDSGQLVTVVPIQGIDLKAGDVVLCKVGRAQYLHLIRAISGGRFQIGNMRGHVNGWITNRSIYGIVTEVKA